MNTRYLSASAIAAFIFMLSTSAYAKIILKASDVKRAGGGGGSQLIAEVTFTVVEENNKTLPNPVVLQRQNASGGNSGGQTLTRAQLLAGFEADVSSAPNIMPVSKGFTFHLKGVNNGNKLKVSTGGHSGGLALNALGLPGGSAQSFQITEGTASLDLPDELGGSTMGLSFLNGTQGGSLGLSYISTADPDVFDMQLAASDLFLADSGPGIGSSTVGVVGGVVGQLEFITATTGLISGEFETSMVNDLFRDDLSTGFGPVVSSMGFAGSFSYDELTDLTTMSIEFGDGHGNPDLDAITIFSVPIPTPMTGAPLVLAGLGIIRRRR